jgi:hypothetical protein
VGTIVFRRRFDDLTDDAFDSTLAREQIELDDVVDEADDNDFLPVLLLVFVLEVLLFLLALTTAPPPPPPPLDNDDDDEDAIALVPLRRLLIELVSTFVLSVNDDEL